MPLYLINSLFHDFECLDLPLKSLQLIAALGGLLLEEEYVVYSCRHKTKAHQTHTSERVKSHHINTH